MALMILVDKLIESLDRGEYVIGIFLDFQKPLIPLIVRYYYRNCTITEYEDLPMTGFIAI